MKNLDANSENTVVEKSFEFAVRIVNLHRFLCNTRNEYVMSKQILRCGTSIGANITEAQKGQSKADFTAKMQIALKEANETEYWLRLLHRTEYITKEQFASMHRDVKELIALLSSICKSSKETVK